MAYRQNSWDNNPTDENGEETKEVNHGNTGLPFGLCAKYGIGLPKNATPRDAWNALAGKGIYPPWTEKGAKSDLWSSEELKTTTISENIQEYASTVKTTSKTTDWATKEVARAIGTVNQKVSLERLNFIDLTNRGKTFYARACGGSLTVTVEALKKTEADVDSLYKESVVEFQKRQEASRERCLKNASEAGSDSAKQIYIDAANRATAFNRWTVEYENGGLSNTIYHELGHVVADQYSGMINRARFLVQGNSKVAPAKARPLIRQAYGDCRQNGEIFKISEYGAQNEHEFFAESFSMYISGKEKLPPTVEKMFKELQL